MKNILIIHGPNMNLIGVRSSLDGSRITLDKINREIRRSARQDGIDLKIFQTHNEAKAVTFLQRNRKSAAGILLSPGPWLKCGYVLQDTLDLLELPFQLISFAPAESIIFNKKSIIVNDNPIQAYLDGLESLIHQSQ